MNNIHQTVMNGIKTTPDGTVSDIQRPDFRNILTLTLTECFFHVQWFLL